MKILIWSNSFYPTIGGLEAASKMLAEEFVNLGHEVTVVTRTPSSEPGRWAFKIVRKPTAAQLFYLVRSHDAYLQNHISLKTAWPLLLIKRPWIVASHTWVPKSGISGFAKHFMMRYTRSISCSREIASHLSIRSTVIPGPYENHVFRNIPGSNRERDLIFVGRLIADKGIFLLPEVLRILGECALQPNLTVVGNGPDAAALVRRVNEMGLSHQVTFVGPKNPSEVATLLNQHKILVAPSLWHEPFGIVALEGIACGCVVVGSDGGGLRDAIGPCGLTFPNGDVTAFANCLKQVINEPDSCLIYQSMAQQHLNNYTSAQVANSYLKVISG